MSKKETTYALITGGASGLGLAFAVECARRGKGLILLDLDADGLDALRSHLQATYQTPVIVQAVDLTDWVQLEQVVGPLVKKYPVCWLINNAGMGGTAVFNETDQLRLDTMLQLNVRATVWLTRALLPGMLKQTSAMVINVASIAAFAPLPYKMIYPATKAFILAFTQGLQEEYRNSNVHFATVHPGAIMTSFDTARRALTQGWAGIHSTLTAQTIAHYTLDAGLRGRRMIIPGWLNKVQYLLTRLFPRRVYLRLSGDMLRRELEQAR